MRDSENVFRSQARALAFCGLLLILALYVVGVASHTILRHVVQTVPAWITVVLGIRASSWSKWTALPCFVTWLFLMVMIWLFLLGWVRVFSGEFSTIEIAMTIVVGASCVVGTLWALRMKTGVTRRGALAGFLVTLAVQVAALRVSFLPGIANR